MVHNKTSTIKLPKQLYYHTDPGHGWLAVKRKLINQLGIGQRISSCSYQNGGTVYLEEDCDAGLFIDAMVQQRYSNDEIKSRIKTKYREHTPIRCYNFYSYAHESH